MVVLRAGAQKVGSLFINGSKRPPAGAKFKLPAANRKSLFPSEPRRLATLVLSLVAPHPMVWQSSFALTPKPLHGAKAELLGPATRPDPVPVKVEPHFLYPSSVFCLLLWQLDLSRSGGRGTTSSVPAFCFLLAAMSTYSAEWLLSSYTYLPYLPPSCLQRWSANAKKVWSPDCGHYCS